jgi:hypothetical protein
MRSVSPPVKPRQLTQAPSNSIMPRASAVLPSCLYDAGVGGASRSGDAIEGTVRKYAITARISSAASRLKLWLTASPIGPDAVPRASACLIVR